MVTKDSLSQWVLRYEMEHITNIISAPVPLVISSPYLLSLRNEEGEDREEIR